MTVRHIVVMGVAGTGKTTVGSRLAELLGVPFAEGDEFHTDEARAKMGNGIALTDEDRWPWLRRLRDWMNDQEAAGTGTVVACSALRRAYRDVLREAHAPILLIHPVVGEDVLAERMKQRKGHYMPVSLLKSQLDTLEDLEADEVGVEIPATLTPDEIIERALTWINEQESK
ncbi:gluconokinase [Arcanobacterium haemolyticum]|nr:gluconokinase [Arcanobacterium haemolyticum]